MGTAKWLECLQAFPSPKPILLVVATKALNLLAIYTPRETRISCTKGTDLSQRGDEASPKQRLQMTVRGM